MTSIRRIKKTIHHKSNNDLEEAVDALMFLQDEPRRLRLINLEVDHSTSEWSEESSGIASKKPVKKATEAKNSRRKRATTDSSSKTSDSIRSDSTDNSPAAGVLDDSLYSSMTTQQQHNSSSADSEYSHSNHVNNTSTTIIDSFVATHSPSYGDAFSVLQKQKQQISFPSIQTSEPVIQKINQQMKPVEVVMDGAGIHEKLEDDTPPQHDFSQKIKLGNNALVLLHLNVLETNEEARCAFMCLKGNLVGVHFRPPVVYVLTTNRSIHLLNPGDDDEDLLVPDFKLDLENVQQIMTHLGNQGLTIGTIARDKEIEITTGSKALCKNIIESIKMARSEAGFPKPNVIPENHPKQKLLRKSMATFLEVEDSEVQNIKHFVHVFCSKSSVGKSESFYDSGSNFSSVNSEKEGMLMYHLMDPKQQELKSNSCWSTGYFVLNDGYIYCYSDAKKTQLNFFSQVYNNQCRGCRRFHSESIDRPHLIELRIIIDQEAQSLCLATSSESETTLWMNSILKSIHVTSPDTVGKFDGSNCCEKFCHLILTDEHLFLMTRDVNSINFNVMDQKNVSDVTAVYISGHNHKSSCCYLILEFETILSPDSFEWSLYFVTGDERRKFLSSLTTCWERMFQVPLKTLSLDNHYGTSEDYDDFGSVARVTLEKVSLWHVKYASGLHE